MRAYQFARTNWTWIGVMSIWNMDYNSLAPWNEYCDPQGWFAILNRDGTPRPAYWELARMAQGQATPVRSESLLVGVPLRPETRIRVRLQGNNRS